MRTHVTSLVLALGVASISGCSPTKPVEAPPAPALAAAPAPITLPVSINAIMVALVDHASEPLWVAAYKNPATPDAWREAEYDAYQMAIAGKLIQLAGTGPSDEDWVSQPEWKEFADEMSAAGMNALRAAQAKDVTALGTAGDRLVASCEACHKKFKPDLTSMGIYKSPTYPPK